MPDIETLDSTEPLHGHPAEEDAASNLETLRQRVEDLEAFVTRHIGLDWGRVQNPNEPHSNISVESVEFHGGVTQIRPSGIQLASSLWDLRAPPGSYFTASANDEVKKYGAVYFVRDFVEDITAVSRGVHGGYASARSAGTVQVYMLAIDDAAKYAQFLASFDQTTALAKMSVNGAAGFKYVQLSSTSNGSIFNTQPLDGLWLPVQASDPTGSDVTLDGMLLYRSDTDKARLRANGAWVYLASEDVAILKAFLDAKGDLISASADNTPAILSVGGNYLALKALSSATTGLTWMSPTVIQRNTGNVQIVNTTDETDLVSYSLAANQIGPSGGNAGGTGVGIRIRCYGFYTNNSGAGRTFTLKVKYGSDTLYSGTTGSIGASASSRAWDLNILLTPESTTTVVVGGQMIMGPASGFTGAYIDSLASTSLVVNAPILGYTTTGDTTAAKTLSVTITHSAADANLEFTAFATIVEMC